MFKEFVCRICGQVTGTFHSTYANMSIWSTAHFISILGTWGSQFVFGFLCSERNFFADDFFLRCHLFRQTFDVRPSTAHPVGGREGLAYGLLSV